MTPMQPVPYRVAARREEVAHTVTLSLEPVEQAIKPLLPGQFTMLYVSGIGEVPISASRTAPVLEQTIRDVGAVTHALCALRPGQAVGVRGPYGTGWDLEAAAGDDLVFVAGGIGLAPLRPAVLRALADLESYGRITVLVGAKAPRELLYAAELDDWRERGARVEVIVDRAEGGWRGRVGVVTALIDQAAVFAPTTTAFLCGPEIMMRFAGQALVRRGVPAGRVQVSLERNMRCGVGWCGHCQLGPLLLCRDGPVVPYDRAAPLMDVREL